MKKLLFFLLSLIMVLSITACGGSGEDGGSGETPSIDFTGISFADGEFVYDGSEKSIAVSGTLPEGTNVQYTGASATDAGTYNATAKISCSGYNTLTLTATLKINKANITGISVDPEQTIKQDGESHLPEYTGDIASGINIKYFLGDKEITGLKEPGTYDVKMVFSGKNYNELAINVKYSIKLSLAVLANDVINSFGAVPDAWEFLPDSFSPDHRLISSEIKYDDFIQIKNIPTNGMGKQMNMVYSILTYTELASSYVNKVYGAMNIIKNLYSTYLDGSPDNYKSFSGNTGSFAFSIEITDSEYSLSASVGTVNITIYSSLEDEEYGARIQLTDTTVVKYSVSGDAFVFALSILNSAAMMVEFSTDEDGNTTGRVYEYLTVSGVDIIGTSALINVTEDYTVIIGTKGDFIPTSDSRNCEIYSNDSGLLVGTEVREDVDGIIFNTYWFPLICLNGVNTIKKIDEMNGTNSDTIYINGSSDTLHTTLVGLAGITSGKATSRRYDIEFKTMYFFVYNEETEKYESISMEIPMLFIQTEHVESFESDFAKSNKTALSSNKVTLTVENSDFEAILYGYEVLLPIYDMIKDAITRETIIEYCKA